MNRSLSRSSLLLITLVISISSCKPDRTPDPIQPAVRTLVLPETPYNYAEITLPASWDNDALDLFENIPSFNETTDEGATLGRVLFHDINLSSDQTISCESCHHQSSGFSDNNQFSEGINGAMTTRNSMTLTNLSYTRRFFWDRRVNGLENQVLIPIEHPEEMGLFLEEMTTRLSALDYYPALFTAAFGDPEVTSNRVGLALSQYLRSIYSYRSKFDEGEATDFANFTDQELLGKEVYFNGETKCNQCHMTNIFYTPGSMNNGLDLVYSDGGVQNQSGNASDEGRFKVATLRNLSYTAPYMHDGRFNTLEEVIEHYNSGIQAHPNLNDQLTVDSSIGGEPVQMNLTDEEKAALIAFLRTLDDHILMNDIRFSDPFVIE
ncbi:MAG: cytochrome c peroxidase [Flavobacteriales bacterium]|nr:cytochrome c peroxidase [Flavobacteriales bacterium]